MVLGLSVVISASLPDRTSFLRERERERERGEREESRRKRRERAREGGREGGREGKDRHLFTVM